MTKKLDKPQITKAQLKAILDDYKPQPDTDDDDMLMLKQAIQHLEESDRIIFVLYTDLCSEQKLADLLHVSRTPIHSLIVRCRESINNYLQIHKNGNNKSNTNSHNNS